jgi:hypothetical protein
MTNRDKIINFIKKTLIPEARRYKQYLDNQKEISKDKLFTVIIEIERFMELM